MDGEKSSSFLEEYFGGKSVIRHRTRKVTHGDDDANKFEKATTHSTSTGATVFGILIISIDQ
jgi:hypothetical protein